MNKTLLLIICDFLLLNLLALTRWEKAEPVVPAERAAPASAVGQGASAEDDRVALMRRTLEEEQAERSRVEGELRAREARLAEQSGELTKLAGERERLVAEVQQERTGAAQLAAEVARVAEQAKVSQAQLEATQRELAEKAVAVKRREAELADLELRHGQAQEKIEDLSVAVRVAEQEKALLKETTEVLREQVETERVERAKVQETATQLAVGVGQLAQSSNDLTRELRENRPVSANILYSDFMANRVVVRMDMVRPGMLGPIARRGLTDTVVIEDGGQAYALVHWDETPLGGREVVADWERFIFEVARGSAAVRPGVAQALRGDPRVLALPLSAEEVARLGVKPYRLAVDPFKFEEAVLIAKGGAGYGEVAFKLDAGQPGYVRMDTRLVKRLMGDFMPSRGDLVVSRTGELLGLMATADHCVVVGVVVPEKTLRLGEGVLGQGNEAVLEAVQGRVRALPFRLQ